MGRFIRRWLCLLMMLMPVALILVGCSGAAGSVGVAAPPGEDAAVVTINVEVTDRGFQPTSIHIPVGRTVQLVLRNRGSTEHHFRVQGLVPTDLLWLSQPEVAREAGVSAADHASHHAGGFVPFRATSPAGLKPTGFEVHAYARGGAMDAILFTATKTGTFSVRCPLHPEIVGKVIVS